MIGSHRTISNIRVGGRLYLGVNDDYLGDNTGGYDVRVNMQ